VKTFDHLAAAVPVPDPAFDEYWENYLRSMPAFTQGSALELNREQLRVLFKLAFLAGREAAFEELNIVQ